MKTKTQFEQLMESPEFRKLYAIEGLVAEAGEFIARLMEERKVTKAELARRLGQVAGLHHADAQWFYESHRAHPC